MTFLTLKQGDLLVLFSRFPDNNLDKKEEKRSIALMDGYGDAFHSYSAEVIKNAEIGIVQQKDLEILHYQHGDFAIEFMKWMGLKQTRENVNRMLSDLKKANAISIDNRHITIKDLKYLQGICKCDLCPKDVCRI